MKKISLLALSFALLSSKILYADIFSLPVNENILYDGKFPLNEYIIYTEDKKCFAHYLSAYPLTEELMLQITNTQNNCLEKGFAKIQISDNLNNVIWSQEGHFLNGFFIGNLPLNSYTIKRSADENASQYLYYFIDENKELDIRYIGKMKAELVNGNYTAFNACPVFEILLQTQNKDLFKEHSTIQNLFTVAKSYAQTLCPSVETIVFAATDSPSLSDEGVFFQEYLNKDKATALWYPDTEKSFNYIMFPNQKETKKDTYQPQTTEKKQSLYTVHISDKTNKKVLFIDQPYLIKAEQTELTKDLKTGWYQIEADLSAMPDLEKKRSGISLKEKAAIAKIHSAKECKSEKCLSEK